MTPPTGDRGVLVLGDAHADDPANRRALLAAYDAADARVALQAGDLGYYDPPTPTWFVAGNDEDHDAVAALRRGDRALGGERTVHLLAGETAEVTGLRVAGLSGTYAPTQYDRPRSELAGDRRRHFVREDVAALRELDDVDVLVAHQAPHGLLRVGGRDPGCDPVDELLADLSPALCLVGHFHRHAEATLDGTRVVALAPVWQRYYCLDPATLTLERHEAPGVG